MSNNGGSGGIGILGVIVGAVIVVGIGLLLLGNPFATSGKSVNIKVEMPKVSSDK